MVIHEAPHCWVQSCGDSLAAQLHLPGGRWVCSEAYSCGLCNNLPVLCQPLLNAEFYIWLQGGPVEILPFLYLGSAHHASKRDTLDAMGITALLNVSSNCPNHFEDHYQYKCIPVEDNQKTDISFWFMEAIEYIGRKHSYVSLFIVNFGDFSSLFNCQRCIDCH